MIEHELLDLYDIRRGALHMLRTLGLGNPALKQSTKVLSFLWRAELYWSEEIKANLSVVFYFWKDMETCNII